MRSHRNTFRHRTSDQRDADGLTRFLRSFASDVVDLLPPEAWDRLLVIRSAPGAGKTSLLRAFEPPTLKAVGAAPSDYPDLHERLASVEALDGTSPRLLAARVSVRSDFRDIDDLSLPEEGARKIFFRFLDAQILKQALLALVELEGLTGVDDLHRVEFTPTDAEAAWITRLRGPDAASMWTWATDTDRAIREMLDSVLPISLEGAEGHADLYSLRALSDSTIVLDGEALERQPLVMIDDGQWLATDQRQALLAAFVDRSLLVSRWYTERHDALSSEEIIGDGEPSRRYEVLELERATRDMGGTIRGGRRLRAFELMLLDVADRRAARPLFENGDQSDTSFAEHLRSSGHTALDQSKLARAIGTVRDRLAEATTESCQFDRWLQDIPDDNSLDTAIRLREIEILVDRELAKPQLRLIDVALDDDERRRRSSSAIREAAWLFIHREFEIPHYFGAEKIAKLGDHNFDQFLRLSGDLFDEMLTLLTLGRAARLDPAAQERIIGQASTQAWASIPQRRSYGRDIQHLLGRIADFAKRKTYSSAASYAPGVSGIGLSMRNRTLLLDPDFRDRTPGAEALFNALGGAVGHNLLSASLDRRNKEEQWMVLYLNRLLCVRYGLPLGLGGWRPMPLTTMCEWLAAPPTPDLAGEIHEPRLLDA